MGNVPGLPVTIFVLLNSKFTSPAAQDGTRTFSEKEIDNTLYLDSWK
jgi:hypothetical protein